MIFPGMRPDPLAGDADGAIGNKSIVIQVAKLDAFRIAFQEEIADFPEEVITEERQACRTQAGTDRQADSLIIVADAVHVDGA